MKTDLRTLKKEALYREVMDDPSLYYLINSDNFDRMIKGLYNFTKEQWEFMMIQIIEDRRRYEVLKRHYII